MRPREGEAIDPKVFTDSSARQETPCEDYTKEAGTYPKIQLTGMNFKHINQIKMQWILCDFKGLGFNLQYMRNALLGWTWTFSRSEREKKKKLLRRGLFNYIKKSIKWVFFSVGYCFLFSQIHEERSRCGCFFFINTLCAGTQLTGRHAHAHTAAVAPALAFNCVMMCVR